MFYLLHGTDNKKSREKLNNMISSLKVKRPESEIFRINNDNWNEDQVKELIVAQGLFDQKYIIIIDSAINYSDKKEIIVSFAKEMKVSQNVFLILGETIDKKNLNVLTEYAEKVQVFIKTEDINKGFNVFDIADCFGKRDKKNMWVLYLKAIEIGIGTEELLGILFWQAKSILLVNKTKNYTESKLSPFVDSKARNFLKNFSNEEISYFTQSLVDVSVGVREGEGESEVLLEKWILSF